MKSLDELNEFERQVWAATYAAQFVHAELPEELRASARRAARVADLGLDMFREIREARFQEAWREKHPEPIKVLDRIEVKGHGLIIVLSVEPKVGSVIRSGTQSWEVKGVEKPHGPGWTGNFGVILGSSAPQVGEEVTIQRVT